MPVPALWQLLPERRREDPWHAPAFPAPRGIVAKLGQTGKLSLVSAKLKSGQARTSLGGINASLCVDSPVVREKNVDILCQKTTQEVQELHSTILPLDFLAILLREGALNACTEAQICKD